MKVSVISTSWWRRMMICVALSMALLLMAGGILAGRSYAADQAVQFGRIHVMALDNNGNGWAWAGVKPPRPIGEPFGDRLHAPQKAVLMQPEPASYLLRIEGDKWSVFASSETAPNLLVAGLDVWRMALTTDGQNGLAVGAVTAADGKKSPVILQLKGGVWGLTSGVLAPGLLPVDATISADGSAGYITAQDAQGHPSLLSLQNGKWAGIDQPNGANLTHIAVSPDGRNGYAVGSDGAIYMMDASGWKAQGGTLQGSLDSTYAVIRVTADDLGNGWVLAMYDNGETGGRTLTRLVKDRAPKVVDTSELLIISELAVDANGNGLAVGAIGLSPSKPVIMRIMGDTLTALEPASVGVQADFMLPATTVAISYNGQYAWTGNADGQLGPLHLQMAVGMPKTGNAGDFTLAITVGLLALCACGAGLALRHNVSV